MDKENKEKALQKVMGEPVGFDISEPATKIKRNLILVSIVIIVLLWGGVEAKPDVSIFGVSLTGVTSIKMMLGLSALLIYSLVHYLWYCYELYGEWVIRITGVSVGFITGGTFSGDGMDYPSNPKQSTLYNWWRERSRDLPDYRKTANKIEESFEDIKSKIESIRESAGLRYNVDSARDAVQHLQGVIGQLAGEISHANQLLDAARIPVSLERFDRRFRLLLKSQNARVLVVEILFPVLLAVLSAGSIIHFFMKQST